MKRLLGILLVLALVVPVLGVSCGAEPAAEEEQYREAFDSGVEYFNQGKEYLLDAETLVRIGNLDDAALSASRAQGKFRSASSHFYEAYQLATEHGIGADVPPTPQQQTATPTGTEESMILQLIPDSPYIALKTQIHPHSKAWNNWKLSLDLEHQSGELVDRIVEAKQEMAQRAATLEFIKGLLSLAAFLLPLLL